MNVIYISVNCSCFAHLIVFFIHQMALLQVAVIGAGAAGLCALRHLCARPDVFSPVAYEMHDELGGTWVYNLQVGLDDKGRPIHSSMYKNLR